MIATKKKLPANNWRPEVEVTVKVFDSWEKLMPFWGETPEEIIENYAYWSVKDQILFEMEEPPAVRLRLLEHGKTLWIKHYNLHAWRYTVIQQEEGLLIFRKWYGIQKDDHYHSRIVLTQEEVEDFMYYIYEVQPK